MKPEHELPVLELSGHGLDEPRQAEQRPRAAEATSPGDRQRRGGRVILHIDMNAFYCSVHEAVEPERYRGKPIAVAGSVEQRKGIVVTSSYAARARGVRTGMRVNEALKACPELIVIPPDFDLYRSFSKRFMNIVRDYSPLVEATSIDECYVDITGSSQFGSPLEIAATIQRRILDELSLMCSIGIGPNKLLAKMASDMKKPGGITVLRIRDVPRLLWDKPCSHLFGIGRRTAEKLRALNIRTIGQLAQADERMLVRSFGVHGAALKQAANGVDHSPVSPVREQNKSIGHTTTLPYDLTELKEIRRVFLNLADQAARRLRRKGLLAQTVQITIRDPRMKTITRAVTLATPTENANDVYREACNLFMKHWEAGKPVRLLGVTLQNLLPRDSAAIQLDLFDYEKQPKRERLNRVMDGIREKFGENAIITAGMIGNDPSALLYGRKTRGAGPLHGSSRT
jgi:DNA polymerase-4